MATNTPNYQLRKPATSDSVNVETDINDSMDTIDAELKSVSDVADAAAAGGTVQTYSPTWASASNPQPAIGNGTLVARYVQTGKKISLALRFVAGSTTTFGTGDWSFTLPATSINVTGLEFFGQCTTLDVSTQYRFDVCNVGAGASILRMIGAAGSFYSPTVPQAWANTDFLNLSLTYFAV